MLVDGGNDLLDEASLLDQRTRGVVVRIALRETSEIGQHTALVAKEFEVLRLHVCDLSAVHAGALFNNRAITCRPRIS